MKLWRQRRPFTEPELATLNRLLNPYTEFWTDGFWAGANWCATTTVLDWDRVPPRHQTLLQLALDPAVDDWDYDPTTGVLKTQINYWARHAADRQYLGAEYQNQSRWNKLEQVQALWENLLIRKTIQYPAIHRQ